MKRLLVIFSFLFILFTILNALELTHSEKEWLNDRSIFKILVSSDNPPYEYIDENGQLTGINITLYQKLFDKLGKKIVFTTNINSFIDIDLISSLAKSHPLYDMSSPTLYLIKLYSISFYNHKDLQAYDNVFILKQNFINNYIKEFNNKPIQVYSDLKIAYNDFKLTKNSILIVDNFRLWEIDQLSKRAENIFYTQKLNMEFPVYLNLKKEDKTFFNVITKCSTELMEYNSIYPILEDWEGIYKKRFEIRYYQNRLYVIFAVILILYFITFFLIFRHNVLRGRLYESIHKTNQKNRELSLENKLLAEQLDMVEKENITVLDNINNLAITLDLKGTIRYINNIVHSVLGYSQNSLMGINIGEILTNEEKQKILSISNNIFDKKNNEIEIRSKEGLKKYFIFTTHFSKSPQGVPQINCILQDITDRKALENRLEAYTNHLEDLVKQRTHILRESEERFRFIVEKAYDGIFMLQNDRFQLVNQTFCEMLNYSKEDLLSHKISFFNLIAIDERNYFIENFNNFKKKHLDSQIFFQTFMKSGGQPVEVEIHFTSITYNDQIVELGVVHDVIEKRIREREQLEHEKLNVVSSFAITANDMINSPLNAILGYIELLDIEFKEKNQLQEKAFHNLYESIEIIRKIMYQLRSITNITLKSYNLKDLKMLKLDDDFSKYEDFRGEHE